jgi:uncharacterized protein (DUF305 family)
MMSAASRGSTLVVLAATALTACARTTPAVGQSSPVASAQTAAGPATPRATTDTTPSTPSAADVNFMNGMISHHAQALVMAGWAPSHGASPSVRVLCERIVNEQNDEIATMQQWLRDRKQPVPEAKPGPMKMVMNGVEHMMMMPGMLTDEQMKQLDAARGPEFDRLFLTYMIQHHKGAVSMVNDLFATNGAAQDQTVFKLASDVQVDQTTEVARMEKMLASLPNNGRAP